MPRNGDVWYVDTSALVKIIVVERESEALRRWLAAGPILVSCDLIRVEAVRAVRISDPAAVPAVLRALTALTLIRLDDDLLATAADLQPPLLRTLDAIHLAAAMRVGQDLAAVLTYDRRMAEGARAAGLSVFAPVDQVG